MLSLADFFVVGLALDIAGAVLLARGLLLSSSAMATFDTLGAIGVGDVLARITDRVDAEFGVAALALGFLLQAVGYAATLLGAETATGTSEGLTALVLGGLAAGAVVLLWRRLRPRRIRGLIVRVALARKGAGAPGR